MSLLLLSFLLMGPLAATAAHAQDAALLLGYRSPVSIPRPIPYYAGSADSLARPTYHTALITSRNGTISTLGDLPGLLVPRSGGFWRVDTKRSIYNDWVEDFVWSAPLNGTTKFPGIQAYNGEYCQGHRTQTINFASPRYLSIEVQTAGYCEDAAHPWTFNTFAVIPIDSTASLGLPISTVLGDAGQAALVSAAEEYLSGLPPDERERYLPEPDAASWNVVRKHGHWAIQGRLDPASVALSATADFDVETQIPPALVGADTLAPGWPRIRAFAPDAVDAFSSPGGGILAILHPASLTVHTVTDGEIGPASLTMKVPQGTRAVMARWANGPAIARWMEPFTRSAARSER